MGKNRLWIIGSILVMAVVIGGGWFLGVQPQLDVASAARSDRAAVDAQNAALEADLAALKVQYESLDEFKADLADLRKGIPASAKFDDFTGQLAAMAAANGVVVGGFSSAVAVPFTPSATSAEEIGTSLDGINFVAIPIAISAVGPRQNIIDFGQALQMGERILIIRDFNVSENDERPDLFEADIQAILYVIVDPNAPLGDALIPAADANDEAKENEDSEESEEETSTPTPTPTPTP